MIACGGFRPQASASRTAAESFKTKAVRRIVLAGIAVVALPCLDEKSQSRTSRTFFIHRSGVAITFLAGGYPRSGQVTMNNPGLSSSARGGYVQSAFRFFQPTFQPGA
jgi:hypothetical protein